MYLRNVFTLQRENVRWHKEGDDLELPSVALGQHPCQPPWIAGSPALPERCWQAQSFSMGPGELTGVHQQLRRAGQCCVPWRLQAMRSRVNVLETGSYERSSFEEVLVLQTD